MEMTPIRRMTSGLLEISAGRIRILSANSFMSGKNSFSVSSLKVMEQVEANLHLPLRMRARTASCITSVYIMNGGISAFSPKS